MNVSVPSSNIALWMFTTSLFIVSLCLAKKSLKTKGKRGTVLVIEPLTFGNVLGVPAASALIWECQGMSGGALVS